MKILKQINLIKLIFVGFFFFAFFNVTVEAANITISVGNTSMGAMILGNNYNSTSLFCMINTTGSWTLSVQDNDTALAYKIANPKSIGNMTNWSGGNYVGPSLSRNINVSGSGFAGPYIGLTGSPQLIASGGTGVINMSIPLFFKQTVIGGDPQVLAPNSLRVVIRFTGTST